MMLNNVSGFRTIIRNVLASAATLIRCIARSVTVFNTNASELQCRQCCAGSIFDRIFASSAQPSPPRTFMLF